MSKIKTFKAKEIDIQGYESLHDCDCALGDNGLMVFHDGSHDWYRLEIVNRIQGIVPTEEPKTEQPKIYFSYR